MWKKLSNACCCEINDFKGPVAECCVTSQSLQLLNSDKHKDPVLSFHQFNHKGGDLRITKQGALALKLFLLEYAALPLKQLHNDQLKLPNSPVMQSFLGIFTEKCCGILLEKEMKMIVLKYLIGQHMNNFPIFELSLK